MGELLIVDFGKKRVISRSHYWRDAKTLHREALQRFSAGGARKRD